MKLVFGQTGSKIATVRVTIDSGSTREYNKWTPGLAHLLEHMIFQGSKNMNNQEACRTIARLGGSWNAYTSHSRVTFFINAPHENIEKATIILHDFLTQRDFKQETLDKEKLVVLEEENGSHDDIDNKIAEEMDKFLCNGPLTTPILGTKESIASITLEELNAFCDKYYTDDNMLVTITSLNPEHKKLGELFGQDNNKFKTDDKVLNTYTKKKNGEFLTSIQQPRIFISYKMLPIGNKNLLNIQFMEYFFSRGMDSRLFQILRQDHSLCYGIGSHLAAYSDIGWLVFWTYVNKENVKKATNLINKEIKKLVEFGPTKEEMERAKNKMISEIYSRMETSYGLNSLLDNSSFYKMPSIDKTLDKIKKMTVKKVQTACEEALLPELKQTFICMPEPSKEDK